MPSLGLLLNTVSPSTFSSKPSKAENKIHFYPTRTKLHHHHHTSPSSSIRCRASSSSSSTISDYDLYDLLGIDSSSDQTQIKKAYRTLQKRCHPDIAGPDGHDMAIILNEVYSVLSDPSSRSAYDQEQAKLSEFQGYTGKPLYSSWFGSDSEERAVFVDEVKCVGCLKCALFANKTFAIESVYGRARVVAQWADPEDKILDAIQICPVDCISIVERTNLAALEFLMSKQPRGSVRMSAGNTVGTRVSNIFADVENFQRKFHDMKEKVSEKESKESNFQRESRISAMHLIRSISNWIYWQSPTTSRPDTETSLTLIHVARKTTQPNTERLREAAAKHKTRKHTERAGQTLNYKYDEEYWTPALILPSPPQSSNTTTSSEPQPIDVLEDTQEEAISTGVIDKRQRNPISLMFPTVMAVVSAAKVGLEGGEITSSGLKEHIGGTKALELINSFELQVLLAGITWFLIGLAVTGAVEALRGKVFRR